MQGITNECVQLGTGITLAVQGAGTKKTMINKEQMHKLEGLKQKF